MFNCIHKYKTNYSFVKRYKQNKTPVTTSYVQQKTQKKQCTAEYDILSRLHRFVVEVFQ